MKKTTLASMLAVAGLCAVLPACETLTVSDADKAKLETDAKAAYTAAAPELKTLATDAAPVVEAAAKEAISK